MSNQKHREHSTPRSTRKSRRALALFVPTWVREILPRLKGAPASVLLAYASHANRDRRSWPSLSLLERETGFERHRIQKARGELVEFELLRPEGEWQSRDAGRFARRVFILTVPRSTVGRKPSYGAAGRKTAGGRTAGSRTAGSEPSLEGSHI